MDGRERGWWPNGRLGLTTPEAHVLLHGAKRGADRAFKLAVMELVGRGWFELAEVGGGNVLGRGDERSRPASPSAGRRGWAVRGRRPPGRRERPATAGGSRPGGARQVRLAGGVRGARGVAGARGAGPVREAGAAARGARPVPALGADARGGRKREELERSRALGEERLSRVRKAGYASQILSLVGSRVAKSSFDNRHSCKEWYAGNGAPIKPTQARCARPSRRSPERSRTDGPGSADGRSTGRERRDRRPRPRAAACASGSVAPETPGEVRSMFFRAPHFFLLGPAAAMRYAVVGLVWSRTPQTNRSACSPRSARPTTRRDG